MARKPKEVEVIEHEPGTKTVARKRSWIKRVNTIWLIITLLWLALVAYAPLYVKNNYSQPIKKSIVVSMFFDLQRYLQEQYSALLKSVAGAIDLSKPIATAIDGVKMAEGAVNKVTDTTAKVTDATAKADKATEKAGKITGLLGKFGVDTSGADKVIAGADNAIAKTNDTVAKVDDVAAMVNQKLDAVKTNLTKLAQTSLDDELDKVIKAALDKETGGLGTTLLTDYGIEHVMPWKPSTWPTTTKIYDQLEGSSVTVITSLTAMVDQYFDYVAWGLVIVAWLVGLIIWFSINSKVQSLKKPFLVCPRCGHTYIDKRGGFMLLNVIQPWKWFA